MSGQSRTYPALLVCLGLETINYSLVFHRTLTTCFLAFLSCSYSCTYSFLKAMARGDEHHSKHRQDVSASSSGPSAKPKKLAKRPRPSSYQEKSSPEASPPRGGTPDEMECLKLYSSEVHTNQEIMNYSKEDLMNLITIRNKPC
jgi:hypothetical protein